MSCGTSLGVVAFQKVLLEQERFPDQLEHEFAIRKQPRLVLLRRKILDTGGMVFFALRASRSMRRIRSMLEVFCFGSLICSRNARNGCSSGEEQSDGEAKNPNHYSSCLHSVFAAARMRRLLLLACRIPRLPRLALGLRLRLQLLARLTARCRCGLCHVSS